MAQPYYVLFCFGALAGVIAASRAYGRFIGVFAAAACGVSVAWIMPPTFSFQVHGFPDQFALAAYGAVSILVLARIRATHADDCSPEIVSGTLPHSRISLGQLIPSVEGVEISVADLAIASDPQRAREVLDEVFRLALARSDVEKISVYGGRWPGVDRIWVAARYRSLPDEPCVLMSGRKADSPASVSSFDNGYERVYQIALPTANKQ